MATTDSNGVLFYQDTDNYTPIQTALNLAQSNLSNLLGSKPRFERVANTTARNALVSSVGAGNISKAHPLLVWRADAADGLQLEYTTNGSTWRTIADKEYYDAQAAAQDTGWVAGVTLSAGYAGSENLGVRRIGKQVFMRGAIARSDASNFATSLGIVGSLPEGFRPGNYHRVPGTAYPTPTSRGAEMSLSSNGDIRIGSIGAGTDICRVNTNWLID